MCPLTTGKGGAHLLTWPSTHGPCWQASFCSLLRLAPAAWSQAYFPGNTQIPCQTEGTISKTGSGSPRNHKPGPATLPWSDHLSQKLSLIPTSSCSLLKPLMWNLSKNHSMVAPTQMLKPILGMETTHSNGWPSGSLWLRPFELVCPQWQPVSCVEKIPVEP